jgi:hypothetical protein
MNSPRALTRVGEADFTPPVEHPVAEVFRITSGFRRQAERAETLDQHAFQLIVSQRYQTHQARWVRHKDWDVAIAEGDPA